MKQVLCGVGKTQTGTNRGKGTRTCQDNDSPEGEDGQWPVRLVRVRIGHGFAPKVVCKDLSQVRAPTHDVRVRADGGQVIVDKVTVQRVQETSDRQHEQQNLEPKFVTAIAAGLWLLREQQVSEPGFDQSGQGRAATAGRWSVSISLTSALSITCLVPVLAVEPALVKGETPLVRSAHAASTAPLCLSVWRQERVE